MTDLDKHIAKNPSAFDGTPIAQQLRELQAPVSLYASIRDQLWSSYQFVVYFNGGPQQLIERELDALDKLHQKVIF